MIVHVRCRGLTPLLMNRMSESVLEGLRTKTKPAKSKAVGNTKTPRQDAEPKVYVTATGRPMIPGENLMACLIAAGVYVRLDGKRQVSTGKATVLPGLMQLLDFAMPLYAPDTNGIAAWEADVRRGTNPNGNEAVAICRPRFDAWSFATRVDIDDQTIGEDTIRQLWDIAGKRIGLGDFRPARKGVFGQFIVEGWDREDASGKAAE